MTTKRILITGASGCIGHYVTEALIQETHHELYLLVRNPKKLQIDCESRPGVTILQSDLRNIHQYRELLQTIDVAILIATAWGGQQEVIDTNVFKTVQLVKLLNPQVCEQIIYFSTASILDRNNQLLQEAGQLGTDYIRSKYDCYRQLAKLKDVPPITALYPTLVFGGEDHKPYSHLSAGLAETLKWIDLARYFKAEGSFHFIHARDIAQVVRYFVDAPPPLTPSKSAITNHFVLGNQPLSANQAVEEICDYLHKTIPFRVPLSFQLAEVLISVLGFLGVKIEIGSWDWFCMHYRHFTYQDPVNPASLGLPSYCQTLRELLQVSGISQPSPESKSHPSSQSMDSQVEN